MVWNSGYRTGTLQFFVSLVFGELAVNCNSPILHVANFWRVKASFHTPAYSAIAEKLASFLLTNAYNTQIAAGSEICYALELQTKS